MALGDLIGTILDLVTIGSWRATIGAVLGLGAGAAVYFGSGQSTAGAAVALVIGFIGVISGIVWDVVVAKRGS